MINSDMLSNYIKTIKKATYLDIGNNNKLKDIVYNIQDDKIMIMGHTFLSETIYNPKYNYKNTQMFVRIDKIGNMHTVSLTLSIPPRENSNIFSVKLLERYMKINNLLNG